MELLGLATRGWLRLRGFLRAASLAGMMAVAVSCPSGAFRQHVKILKGGELQEGFPAFIARYGVHLTAPANSIRLFARFSEFKGTVA